MRLTRLLPFAVLLVACGAARASSADRTFLPAVLQHGYFSPAASVWRPATSPTTGSVTSVVAVSPSSGYANVFDSLAPTALLRTADGGDTWTSGPTSACCGLRTLAASPQGVLWLAGGGGSSFMHARILRSADGGANWTVLYLDACDPDRRTVGVDLYDVAAPSDSVAWAVGFDPFGRGTIVRTADADATCVLQPSGVTARLFGVAALSTASALAVGEAGTILRTDDGGATWSRPASGTTANLVGVVMASASVAWAVGGNGTILRSTDGGTTWVAQTSGTTSGLTSIAAASVDEAWVVGTGGTILYTRDGGATWTTQRSGTANALYDAAAASRYLVWAVGANGTILKATPD